MGARGPVRPRPRARARSSAVGRRARLPQTLRQRGQYVTVAYAADVTVCVWPGVLRPGAPPPSLSNKA